MPLDPEFFPPQVDEPEETEEEEKKPNLLFEFLDSIHFTKKNLIEDPNRDPSVMEKEYGRMAYVINHALGMFPDTVLYAQEMNERSKLLDPKMQYLFLLESVVRRKRYSPKGSKMFGKVTIDNLEAVQEYFGYSKKKAINALDILTEEQIEQVKVWCHKGGVEKTTRKKSAR